MELDNDHIHFIVSFPPAYSIEQTVRRMKMISTNYVYERCENYLKKFYWKDKRLLWTHGYFCSTIGEVSEQMVKHYIENQGWIHMRNWRFHIILQRLIIKNIISVITTQYHEKHICNVSQRGSILNYLFQ